MSSKKVIHYKSNAAAVAVCGGHVGHNYSSYKLKVTCKNCKRTKVYIAASFNPKSFADIFDELRRIAANFPPIQTATEADLDRLSGLVTSPTLPKEVEQIDRIEVKPTDEEWDLL